MSILGGDPSENQTKTCLDCGEAKPLSEYYERKDRGGKPFPRCKSCHNAKTLSDYHRRKAADPEGENAKRRQYVTDNKERVDAYRRSYVDANRDRINALNRARRATPEGKAKAKAKKRRFRSNPINAAKEKSSKADYRKRNKEKIAEYARVRREMFPAKVSGFARRWQANNPEKFAVIRHKARAKRRAILAGQYGDVGSYTAAEWRAVKRRQNLFCLLCGLREPMIRLTPDHIKPLAKGGKNTIDNIQGLCVHCNSHKRIREWDLRDNVGPDGMFRLRVDPRKKKKRIA